MTPQQQHLALNQQDQNFDHSVQNYICFILTRREAFLLKTHPCDIRHKVTDGSEVDGMFACSLICLGIIQVAVDPFFFYWDSVFTYADTQIVKP